MLQIVSEQRDTETVLHLKGRLDMGGARSANAPFMEEAEHADRIILDCAELEYVASAGLRVLKMLHQVMTEKGGTVILKAVSHDVMDVLEMTGFDAMFIIEA